MNPIELIRHGITKGNWGYVCEGFTVMTGERVSPPPDNEGYVHSLQEVLNQIEEVLAGRIDRASPKELVDALDEFDGEQESAVEEDDESGDENPDAWTYPEERDFEDYDDPDDPDDDEGSDPSPSEPDPPPPNPPSSVEAVDPQYPSEDVNERGRQLRQMRHGQLDISRFEVQHKGAAREDGKVESKALPFKPGMTNTFVDTLTLARNEIASDRKMTKKLVPTPRRAPVTRVAVVCQKCGTEEEVEPIFAPRKIEGELSAYVCNGCITKKKPMRRLDD